MPIPFSRRAREFVHRHRLLLSLMAVDLVTKVAAFALLPHGRPVPVLPGVTLYLAVNEWGVMGGVRGIGAVTANPAYTMGLAFGLFVFAAVILRLGASTLGFGWRFLVGTAVFLLIAFAAQAVAIPFAHFTLPADVIVMTIRVAALTVSVAFYAASTAPIPRVAFALLAAGALANALSYAYPPFEVVDFLMVPVQPVLKLLARAGGAASGDTEGVVGVINMADVYLLVFPLLLAAWPLLALLRGRRRPAGT